MNEMWLMVFVVMQWSHGPDAELGDTFGHGGKIYTMKYETEQSCVRDGIIRTQSYRNRSDADVGFGVTFSCIPCIKDFNGT